MYVGVDVGGTKTLVAVLDNHGVIKEKTVFQTPKTYDNWLLELKHAVHHLEHKEFKAGGVAMPGHIDRTHGRVYKFGNLKWPKVNVQHDVERVLSCPVVVENDAKMGALSEAMLLKNKFKKVAYVTISTGIGYALVVDGKIDTSLGDAGARAILLDYKDKQMAWEDFASGRAIVEIYGKQAKDIHDKETWREISRELAKGFIHLIAIMEPEVIVVGGSVGRYFEKYGDLLVEEIKKYELPTVKLPKLMEAQRPEEAVVFGCYDLAKQTFSHA